MQFTKNEIIDLIKAWVVIALIFAIASRPANDEFIRVLLSSAFAVGVGFLLHELAHKFVAQRYGLKAHFEAFEKTYFISIVLALFQFIFIAPGAVMIKGATDKIRLGRIAVAGPVTNIVIAILALIGNLFHPSTLLSFTAYINAFLAVFNMLPILVLDGKKVWNWNRNVFWSVMIVSIILVFIA